VTGWRRTSPPPFGTFEVLLSEGVSFRLRKRNSGGKPHPSAPLRSATSLLRENSMFARSRSVFPSRVTVGSRANSPGRGSAARRPPAHQVLPDRLPSGRRRPPLPRRRRSPSPRPVFLRRPSTPTTAGIPRERAVIAVWDVRLPTFGGNRARDFQDLPVSPGEVWATMIPGRDRGDRVHGAAGEFSRTRWPIWRMVVSTLPKVGSSSCELSRTFWSTLLNAQSAANWLSRISGSSARSASSPRGGPGGTERIWCVPRRGPPRVPDVQDLLREGHRPLKAATSRPPDRGRPSADRRGRTGQEESLPDADAPEAGIPFRIRIFLRPSVPLLLLPNFRSINSRCRHGSSGIRPPRGSDLCPSAPPASARP